MAIDFSYTPGSANSLAASYNAAEQTRNQLAQQARANQVGDFQLRGLQQQEAERQGVADAYKAAYNPDNGQLDQGALVQHLAQGGFGHLVPEIQSKLLGTAKDQSIIDENRAKAAASTAKLKQDKLDWAWQGVGSASTPEAAIQHINQGVRDGIISMQEGSAELKKLEGITPENFGQYRMTALQKTMAAKDQADMLAPKIDRLDRGGSFIATQGNRFQPGYGGIVAGVPPIAKTATFGEKTAQGQLGLAQRKFQFEQDNPGFEYSEDADGNRMATNKRTNIATPVMVGGAAPAAPAVNNALSPRVALSAAPAATQAIPGMRSVLDQTAPETPMAAGVPAAPVAGTPLRGKGTPMTESQSNAAMFGGAMTQAQSVIKDVASRGTYKSAVVPGLLEGLVKLAPFGVGDAAANAVESTFRADPTGWVGPNQDQQKLAQAQIAFATAYLRKTSGAAFGPQEVANTIKEFFPLRGESDVVIQQKDAARDRVIEGISLGTNKEGRAHINKYVTHPEFPGFSIAKP